MAISNSSNTPLLDQVQVPADLRRLEENELGALADEALKYDRCGGDVLGKMCIATSRQAIRKIRRLAVESFE